MSSHRILRKLSQDPVSAVLRYALLGRARAASMTSSVCKQQRARGQFAKASDIPLGQLPSRNACDYKREKPPAQGQGIHSVTDVVTDALPLSASCRLLWRALSVDAFCSYMPALLRSRLMRSLVYRLKLHFSRLHLRESPD